MNVELPIESSQGVSAHGGDLNVGLAWWNTGMSPIQGARKVDVQKVYCALIRLCLDNDVVVLCEHKPEDFDINLLNNDLHTLGCKKVFNLIDLVCSKGHAGFKMIMLIESTRVQHHPQPMNESVKFGMYGDVNTDNYRVVQVVNLDLLAIDLNLDVYLFHWSQRDEQDGESVKIAASSTAVSFIDARNPKYAICLGDFNTEPYSVAMANLGATRSIDYAVCNEARFYNPCWKFMPYIGTLNKAQKRSLKCAHPMFDQILIGRSLLSDGYSHAVTVYGDYVYEPSDAAHRPLRLALRK